VGAPARPPLLALLVAVTGCTPQVDAKYWERPGATQSTIFRDASDCSAIAWTEAERQHPYDPALPTSTIGVQSRLMEQRQQIDQRRFATAARLDDLCMLNRGYRSAPAPPR